MNSDALPAFLRLTVSLAWLAFVSVVVYDLHKFGAEMERLGRECASMAGVPYTGQRCTELFRIISRT